MTNDETNTMPIIDKVIDIGIQRISNAREMATLIKLADTKEDILLIFEHMNEQIDEGIAEIDMLCRDI